MYCRLPAKSAKASVLLPIVLSNPGGPPRCWMYGWPSALAVAKKKVSMTARNCRRSSVTSEFHSRSSNWTRDPRRICSALTAGENITSSGPVIPSSSWLFQFLAELARHFLDELPGNAARACATRHRPFDRLLTQAFDRHAELVEVGVAFDHREEGVLVGV